MVYPMFLMEWISVSEISTESELASFTSTLKVPSCLYQCAYIMIYKGGFKLELAVYNLAQMSVTLSSLCYFVVEYLLFVFCQNTPQDLAAQWDHEAVVAYLKRAADPNVLEVCETAPLRIVVVSSGEAPTLTDTS